MMNAVKPSHSVGDPMVSGMSAIVCQEPAAMSQGTPMQQERAEVQIRPKISPEPPEVAGAR